jgi:hypothetical protein
MEYLSVSEILELTLLSEAAIDAQVQFWLTATFATIVASVVGRSLLTPKLRALVLSLYLTATFVFVSRWYYEANDLGNYQEMLDLIGYENKPPALTIIGRLVLMAFGTCATAYFVYFTRFNENANE